MRVLQMMMMVAMRNRRYFRKYENTVNLHKIYMDIRAYRVFICRSDNFIFHQFLSSEL